MSLKAIAKALGISITTVSRALNGYSDVSEQTRARIEAEAQKRGYRPNTMARRLKMGKIDAVGLVFPANATPLNNDLFIAMVDAVSHELAKDDIDLLLIADDERNDKHSYMRLVQSHRIDALIVAHTLNDDPRLQQLQAINFPFLALGRSQLPQPYAWFDFDNYAGTYQATRYLIEKGHQRIAMLSKHSPQSFISQRRQGYLDALKESGLSDTLLHILPPTRRAGYQLTQQLLQQSSAPSAILTDSSIHGDGCAMALSQHHRLTGDDAIALVIYDGLPEDSIVEEDVAAIRQSATSEQVGQQIADLVRRLIIGEDKSQLQVLWQPRFSPGQTA